MWSENEIKELKAKKPKLRNPAFTGNSTRKQDTRGTKKKSQICIFEDVDSLSCLKQKKTENIDEKFNLLKSELQSLFHSQKAGTSGNLSRHQEKLDKTQHCDKFKKHQDSSIISSSSKPSKFSEWLGETIDKIDVKSVDSSINEKLDCDETLPSTAKLGFKSKYNMRLLPKYKVERLLYKTFQLQNLGIYVLSSSDESEAEQLKSKRIRNQKKRSIKSRCSSFPKRNLKRKKTTLDSTGIEVINLEDSLKKDEPKNIHYVDLDVDSYDWNEPFHSKSHTDSSDLEIVEDSQSSIGLSAKKQNNSAKLKESDFSTNTQEQNSSENITSPNTKKVWECPICFEVSRGQSIVATPCGHIFCKACLEKHNSTQGKRCPTCRFDLSNKPPITLFNL